MESLNGKKALVIGGGGDIGRCICHALVKENTQLVIHSGHDTETFASFVTSLKNEMKTNDIRVLIHEFTFNNLNEISQSVLMDDLKQTDILCVCVGTFLQKKIHTMTSSEWCTIGGINYVLPGILTSIVLTYMLQRFFGRILLFGGTRTSVVQGYRTNAAYAGAKTGVCSLVKSIAMEYGQYGITCNAVLPGFTDTCQLSILQKKSLEQKMPLGKLITPEQISSAALYLLSESELNGVLLPVDYGWSP